MQVERATPQSTASSVQAGSQTHRISPRESSARRHGRPAREAGAQERDHRLDVDRQGFTLIKVRNDGDRVQDPHQKQEARDVCHRRYPIGVRRRRLRGRRTALRRCRPRRRMRHIKRSCGNPGRLHDWRCPLPKTRAPTASTTTRRRSRAARSATNSARARVSRGAPTEERALQSRGRHRARSAPCNGRPRGSGPRAYPTRQRGHGRER
jgi:hypothetical protein